MNFEATDCYGDKLRVHSDEQSVYADAEQMKGGTVKKTQIELNREHVRDLRNQLNNWLGDFPAVPHGAPSFGLGDQKLHFEYDARYCTDKAVIGGREVHFGAQDFQDLYEWLLKNATVKVDVDTKPQLEQGAVDGPEEEPRNAICPALVYVDTKGKQHVLDQGDTVEDPRENALLKALLDHAQPTRVWPHNLAVDHQPVWR